MGVNLFGPFCQMRKLEKWMLWLPSIGAAIKLEITDLGENYLKGERNYMRFNRKSNDSMSRYVGALRHVLLTLFVPQMFNTLQCIVQCTITCNCGGACFLGTSTASFVCCVSLTNTCIV